MNDLLPITVVPHMYKCIICSNTLTSKHALGIRLDTNYYFHLSHVQYSYADFIHRMNTNLTNGKERTKV